MDRDGGYWSAGPNALELRAREPTVATAISRLAAATGGVRTIVRRWGIAAPAGRTRALDLAPGTFGWVSSWVMWRGAGPCCDCAN